MKTEKLINKLREIPEEERKTILENELLFVTTRLGADPIKAYKKATKTCNEFNESFEKYKNAQLEKKLKVMGDNGLTTEEINTFVTLIRKLFNTPLHKTST